MSKVVEECLALFTPILEAENVELVDVLYQRGPGGLVLSFLIDKPGGVSLDDCQYWSGRIGPILDEKDMIPNAYSLEVSSPGVRRPLKTLKDFQRFRGERVFVKSYAPVDGQKNFHGILIEADQNSVVVRLSDSSKDVRINRDQIAKSALDPVIEI